MVVGAIWVFLRRPLVLLGLSLILYFYSDRLFGITPLKPYELIEMLGQAQEATVAAAGLVVAIASVTAFKHVKRLDLELAASSAITAIIRDGMDLLTRNRLYCDAVLEVSELWRHRYMTLDLSEEAKRDLDQEIDDAWYGLLRAAPKARVDRDEIWAIARRLIDLNDQHGAVLRSKILTPFFLERALHHFEVIAGAATFVVPSDDATPRTFLPAFPLAGKEGVSAYLALDHRHTLRFLGYLGGASSIGSSAVAPASLVTAVRMAANVWKM